jgi:ribose-phosphate pyrophosphokinase
MSAADRYQVKVFAGRCGAELAEAMCEVLDIPLGQATTGQFPDGEIHVKVEEDVRGRDCFVVQSTCDPVNSSLMELLIFIDCLRRASARRITAVTPYFGYARQDRKDEGRVPITAKLVANLVAAAGADRVLCMDLHAAQVQGFFDIPVDHLTAAPVVLHHLEEHRADLGELVVVSPDVGNVKVANWYADRLDGELAIIDKRRKSGFEVVSRNVIGDVADKTVLMVDDMISTAATVCEAASVVIDHGAVDVVVAATHALFVGPALQRLEDSPISRVIVTDTIPDGPRLRPLANKLVRLSVSTLLGKAVHRIHHDMSVSELFREAVGMKR